MRNCDVLVAGACVALVVTACGGTAAVGAPSTAGPAPVAAPAPRALMDRCPDASDGPSLIAEAVEASNRALVANASARIAPACVALAFSHIGATLPDSLDAHAIAVAEENERRGPDKREALDAEIALFARAHRYAELSRAYDRLVLIDSQPPIDLVRLAASAARQRGDSAALLAIMAKAATRADAP
ncbi:MAG TPA: hypothetical protein VE967_12900, partial [Gemmatimonadaceae bacterium]|nr:hypothetical protein [Gemmatimonadaceae bacterium]